MRVPFESKQMVNYIYILPSSTTAMEISFLKVIIDLCFSVFRISILGHLLARHVGHSEANRARNEAAVLNTGDNLSLVPD